MISSDLYRNLGLDLVRATEAAALSAAHQMGLGNPAMCDVSAGAAMLKTLSATDINGRVVIGEEGKRWTGTPVKTGTAVGTGAGPEIDLILDPVDGCRLLARGYPGAITAIAAAPQGALWAPRPAVYMEKIVVDAEVGAKLVPECLDAPAAWTLALVARAKGKKVKDLTVFVLERPRHADLIAEIRAAGAHVKLYADGDVAGALIAATVGSGIDLLMGIGGIPEGLIGACAARASGGNMLGRLAPQSEEEAAAVAAAGLDTKRIMTEDEMVATNEVIFVATGITEGPLLDGIRFERRLARSNSMIIRGHTRTRRIIHAEHLLEE